MFNSILILLIGLMTWSPAKSQIKTAQDVHSILKRTIDLTQLQQYYTDSERKGLTPIILLNNKGVWDNMILFKFNKRVKILTSDEIKTLGSVFKGNLGSYFKITLYKLPDGKAQVEGTFRKTNPIKINIVLEKKNDQWIVDKCKVTPS